MKNKRGFLTLLPLMLVLSLAANGCSSDSDAGVFASQTGQLSVEIHDHPTPDIVECWVTIDRVEARRLQGEWNPLPGEYPHRFDLLQLQNGRTRVLGEGAVPSGDYDQLQLQLTAVHLVMHNGEEVDVPIPRGGLPIRVPIGQRCQVLEGDGAVVSIDFRVPTSFRHNADDSWTCDPDIAVDGIWQQGQPGNHG